MPPSISSVLPLMKLAIVEQLLIITVSVTRRITSPKLTLTYANVIPSVISSGMPHRPIGILARSISSTAFAAPTWPGVLTSPGQHAMTFVG